MRTIALRLTSTFFLLAFAGLNLSAQQAGKPSPALTSDTAAKPQADAKPAAPAPVERKDPAVDLASEEIGRALYLRCFC